MRAGLRLLSAFVDLLLIPVVHGWGELCCPVHLHLFTNLLNHPCMHALRHMRPHAQLIL